MLQQVLSLELSLSTSLPGDQDCPSIRSSSAPNSTNNASAADREEFAAEDAFCISKCSNTVSFAGQVSLTEISQDLNTPAKSCSII